MKPFGRRTFTFLMIRRLNFLFSCSFRLVFRPHCKRSRWMVRCLRSDGRTRWKVRCACNDCIQFEVTLFSTAIIFFHLCLQLLNAFSGSLDVFVNLFYLFIASLLRRLLLREIELNWVREAIP